MSLPAACAYDLVQVMLRSEAQEPQCSPFAGNVVELPTVREGQAELEPGQVGDAQVQTVVHGHEGTGDVGAHQAQEDFGACIGAWTSCPNSIWGAMMGFG